MKYKNIICCSVATWLTIALNSSSAESIAAETTLPHLFSVALTAQGEEYQKARITILENENAVPFLSQQVQSTNLMNRVIARAMLAWHHDSATNFVINERYAAPVQFFVRSQMGERRIWGEIYDAKTHPRTNKASPDPSVILEIALKGPSLTKSSWASKNERRLFLVRCYAAGMSGQYDDQDAIPVLTYLTGEGQDDFMRKSALLGLRLCESTDIAFFLEGMRDRDAEYRKTAYVEMGNITGQDFGYDAEKYRVWLETNTVNRAALPAK